MNPANTQIGDANTISNLQASGQALLNSGQYNVPNTQTLGTINTSGNMNVPPPPIIDNGLGAITGLSQYQQQQQLLAQNAQQNADQGTNTFNSLLQQYLGQGAEQAQLSQQYDTAGLTQKVRDLQALQASQTAQYIQGLNNIELARNTRQEANAQAVSLNRQRGIDSLLTGAQLQSAQGNLEYAQNLIKTALDLKYEPIKAQLEYQKEIVSQLNTKAATEATRAYDLKIKQLDLQQKEQENIYNLGVTVGKNNAPASVIAKINKAKTFAEASNLAAPYMVSPADKLDLAIKSLQYAKLKAGDSDRRLTIDEAQKLGVPFGTTESQTIALQGKTPATEMQLKTLSGAQDLMSRITAPNKTGLPNSNLPIGTQKIGINFPGSKRADFIALERTLKNQLTLDNLKYLKGPTSDKDILFITSASSALNRNMSVEQYTKTLSEIINTLSKYSPEYQYSQSATGLIESTGNDPYADYTSSVLTQ